jgi:glutamyl/glutaminyl-tRNA synthetase
VRLALPPHGVLTLADAHAALCNWLFARKHAGQVVLRVEDAGRAAPGKEARALDDLRWLGLGWDEEIVRQSERLDRYRAAAGSSRR